MQPTLRDLRLLGTVTLAAVLIAFVTLLASSDHVSADFNPQGEACLDNETTDAECDGVARPSAVSGVATKFNLAAPDPNFAGAIFYTPPEWGVAADADIPNGAIVADLQAKATLGLIGNSCSNSLTVRFIMMDATTDQSTVMADAFKDLNNDDIPDMMEDRDDDGLPDSVTKYPDFLTRLFPGATPRARLQGQTSVSGVPVSLNFVIFEPGTVLETPAQTISPDPSLGYPSATVLQSVGDPDAFPEATAITDFCTPLVTDIITFGTTQDNLCTDAGATPAGCTPIGDLLEGKVGPGGTTPDESGSIYRTNPSAAGTYTFTQFAISQRDADGDGYENGLDPCPFDAAPTWNPRDGSFGTPQTGDSDGDRIPDICDESPDDSFPPSGDVDGDFYLNAGDNCPQVTNGANPASGALIGPNNQKDTDLDGIGDSCDSNPSTPDGERVEVNVLSEVAISGTPVTPGETPTPGAGTDTGNGDTTDSGTGGPSTGVGSLAPAVSSIPAWAAIASGLGGAGLLGSLGAFAARVFGIRRRDRF